MTDLHFLRSLHPLQCRAAAHPAPPAPSATPAVPASSSPCTWENAPLSRRLTTLFPFPPPSLGAVLASRLAWTCSRCWALYASTCLSAWLAGFRRIAGTCNLQEVPSGKTELFRSRRASDETTAYGTGLESVLDMMSAMQLTVWVVQARRCTCHHA
jgi:hypothetical protein